jgi:hypothetical protein
MGIHDVPNQILGKRDPHALDDADHPSINAFDHMQALKMIPRRSVITPTGDPIASMTWPMDHNDAAGDCVVAALDHFLQAVYDLLGVSRNNWTDAQMLAYYQTQNPKFKSWADAGGPNDNGMVIQDFLTYLVKEGTILGFARINPTDEVSMRAATYLDLGVITGQVMQVAQQGKQVWDYVKGSRAWGGHCTVSVGYTLSPNAEQWVSWGDVYLVTPAFIAHQMDEAWFVITQAHVDDPTFREGFNLDSFGSEFTALTGRPFSFQPTPAPNPAPSDMDRTLYGGFVALVNATSKLTNIIAELDTMADALATFAPIIKEWAQSKGYEAKP